MIMKDSMTKTDWAYRLQKKWPLKNFLFRNKKKFLFLKKYCLIQK